MKTKTEIKQFQYEIQAYQDVIFNVGLDEPTQVPEEVVKDSIYKIGNRYYIVEPQKVIF